MKKLTFDPYLRKDILQEPEELIKIFVMSIKTAVVQAHGPVRSIGAEKKQNKQTNDIKLRSEATSLFDVRRWTFDVHLLNQPRRYEKRIAVKP